MGGEENREDGEELDDNISCIQMYTVCPKKRQDCQKMLFDSK
jgi:hypothetical protein